jgi:putative ABC transport system permease protein
VNVIEGLKEAARSLFANKLRSALTALGIVIGVAAVIAVIAIGQGGKAVVINELEGWGSNMMWVEPNDKAYDDTVRRTPMDDKDLGAFSAYDEVIAVAPLADVRSDARYRGNSEAVRMRGTTADFRLIRAFGLSEGRFLSQADDEGQLKVAVLRPGIRDKLFGKGAPSVGKIVRIGNSEFTVVGVTEEYKRGFTNDGTDNDTIFIPFSVAQKMRGTWEVRFIFLKVESADMIDEVGSRITSHLNRRYGLMGGESRFQVGKAKEIIASANRILGTMAAIISGIAAISLLVGGIGIMNIMFVSVVERTREIGVRKAIGAKRADILSQFLIEAVSLCLMGGGIGTLIGVGGAQLASLLARWPSLISWGSVVLALGVSLAIGAFFGIYPAYRAAKLDPVEALRFEG